MTKKRTVRFEILTASESETQRFGHSLGRRIARGACISIIGSLGAGKTVLARSVCLGLDVAEEVVSPTFILCEEYRGRLPVVHVDLYRLEHEDQLEALGIFDRLEGDAVLLVEWGDRSPRLIDESDIVIDISIADGDARRIGVRHTPEFAGFFEKE